MSVADQPSKPLAIPPYPRLPTALVGYVCPRCGFCDWMVRPDGTISCYHCMLHASLMKRSCYKCGLVLQG